jgi:hypothetical protein
VAKKVEMPARRRLRRPPGEVYLEAIGTEVDEETVPTAGGLEVSEDLCFVLRGDGPRGLEFDDQAVLHEVVGIVFSDHRSILVEDSNGMLLLHMEAGLFQAMDEGVLIDLLQVSVTMIDVDVIGSLADLVANGFDVDHGRGLGLGWFSRRGWRTQLHPVPLISAIFALFAVNSFFLFLRSLRSIPPQRRRDLQAHGLDGGHGTGNEAERDRKQRAGDEVTMQKVQGRDRGRDRGR